MGFCCVHKCRGHGGFKFPADPIVRKKWLKAICREHWTPSKWSYLCKKHFRPDDFVKTKVSGM